MVGQVFFCEREILDRDNLLACLKLQNAVDQRETHGSL
jgi:hypothetical protein